MLPILLSITTFFSTLAGGLTALRFRDKLHRFLGYTAGVLLGVVAFDLLPEIIDLVEHTRIETIWPMLALVVGFMAFHIVEKSILIHESQEHEYEVHKHPNVGVVSALALAGHSFLDGVAIGLGFQAGSVIGVAVIAHDFSDGLNTVNLMLVNGNNTMRSRIMLFIDALAPILGAFSTLFFHLPDNLLVIYLGFFAGFLLYISTSEILPEAHSKHSSYSTIFLTILGLLTMFFVTRVV
jgi:zinc transporter ZupT